MKQPTEQQKKKVVTFLNDIQWLFGIQNHDKNLVFKKEPCKNNNDVAAEIAVWEDYQRITISVYPVFWEETPEEQRMFLLHELCHILTDPLDCMVKSLLSGKLQTAEQGKAATEKVTSVFTNLLDAFLQGKSQYAKEAYANYLTKPKKK